MKVDIECMDDRVYSWENMPGEDVMALVEAYESGQPVLRLTQNIVEERTPDGDKGYTQTVHINTRNIIAIITS